MNSISIRSIVQYELPRSNDSCSLLVLGTMFYWETHFHKVNGKGTRRAGFYICILCRLELDCRHEMLAGMLDNKTRSCSYSSFCNFPVLRNGWFGLWGVHGWATGATFGSSMTLPSPLLESWLPSCLALPQALCGQPWLTSVLLQEPFCPKRATKRSIELPATHDFLSVLKSLNQSLTQNYTT